MTAAPAPADLPPARPDARYIPLTQGRSAIVDEADFDWLNQWTWTWKRAPNGHGYVWRRRPTSERHHGDPVQIKMHRLIVGIDGSRLDEVDHINGNTLDNRRSNLRVVTHAQNCQNRRGAQANSSTGIRGVSWSAERRRYVAQVKVGGEQIHVGRFKSAEEAELAVAGARRRLMTHSAECEGKR